MKLNNKGFAISTIMYLILVLAIILISLTLAILSSRRLILDKQKDRTLNNLYLSTSEGSSSGSGESEKKCVEWEEVAPESWYVMCDSFSDYETYISQGSDSYGCYYITYQYAEEMELGPNDSIYRAAKNKFCNGCANISVYTFDCTGSYAWEPMCKFRVSIDTGPIRECVRWE